MKMSVPSQMRAIAVLFAFLSGCSDGGPSGPGDDGNGSVSGKTATFDGLSVTLLQTSDNWESDNQFVTPDPGNRFYTVEVRYQNATGTQQTFNMFDFEIETSASTRLNPVPSWRDPGLGSGNLAPVGQVVGWVTFELPIGQTAVRLLYSPQFDVTLAIPI